MKLIVDLFEQNGSHRDESLRSSIKGLIRKEAHWQPPCYQDATSFPGMPSPGSILWHLAHLEHSARHYNNILENFPVIKEPSTPPPGTIGLSDLIDRLEISREKLKSTITGLDDVDLSRDCARGMTVREFLFMILRHEIWHAGQIAMVRRLYKNRVGS